MREPGEQRDQRPESAGELIAGRYRITGELGRGGMGLVLGARDELLGREVAVKQLRTFKDARGDELDALQRRMRREAKAAARVRHPGAVAVHDVVVHEGSPVIVMELVHGPSLDQVLKERGPISPEEAAHIGARVLDALAAAHRAGVLHRDVKPANILLEPGCSAGDGRVVLTDFGIAAVKDADEGALTRLTGSGELLGSLPYLAPERARGEDPGPSSDVWSLGATLYAAVEGVVPFRHTSAWSTLTAIVSDPLPAPVRAGPLGPVLTELLEKAPARRPDAERAAVLLKAVSAGWPPPLGDRTVRLRRSGSSGPDAGPDGEPQPDTEPRHDRTGRHGRAVAAGSALLLVAAGVAGLLTYDTSVPGESAATSQDGGKAPATEPPGCRRLAERKYTCDTWSAATSYDTAGRSVGTLQAGINYFFCQLRTDRRETSGKWTNVWWAKTDDDSGNRDVLVSVVYLKGGDNDRPVPGLPLCP